MFKAILISMLLTINPENTRTDIGLVRNCESIETTGSQLWRFDTEFPEGTGVIVLFDTNDTVDIYDDIILDVYKIRG